MNILISSYINKLSKDDINNFGIKNSINLSKEELDFTYNFIKKNWELILSNPKSFNIDNYKDYYSVENFNKLKDLYNKSITKYYKYL